MNSKPHPLTLRACVLRYLALFFLFGMAPLEAQEDLSSEQLKHFENFVRPALVKYCYECHSAEGGESRGGLYLDTRDAMREGGSTGPLFDFDNWEYSLFVDAITWADPDFEMPPKNKMPQEVIDSLVEWVKMGAPDPREREQLFVESKIDIEAGKDHWAYQRPVRPELQSIDEIVDAKRSAEGLVPVEAANATTLLRRLTFDLTGLPPTPAQIRAFYDATQQDRDAAIEAKLDELLASPHYGERWGRHWLDVVRYGESSGTLNIIYPYAWRFRNYVIDSFNEDKPYNELLTEHLAGDLLDARSEAERQENLIATAYLALGPKKQNEKNRQVFDMNLIDEQIDTTTRAFIATTVACARCHDHKFDPISTSDYYAMAGIFESTDTLWGTITGNQNHRTSELLELPIPDAGLVSDDGGNAYEEKQRQLEELLKKRTMLRGGRGRDNSSDEKSQGMAEEDKPDQRTLVRMRQQILRAQSELELLSPDGKAITYAMGAREGELVNSQVLVSGDVTKPAQEVERGFPEVLHFTGTPDISSRESGRLQLAEWITSTHNPLTARVMVNRIWQHLTGTPIVETMDNFGTTGLPPTNQDLLDYLAIRFMENGWSIKELIREIVLSDTYQLASTWHPENYALDPANTTHWRANVRQLDAESLRDQMLLVSGLLDRNQPETSMTHELGDSRISQRGRDAVTSIDTSTFRGRSVYLPILRDALPDELGLFDFPDPLGTVGQRRPTNVAPQSLHLMNSDLVQIQAAAMADVLTRNFTSVREQVSNAFLLAYSRPADSTEVAMGLQFLRSFDPGEAPVAEVVPASETRGGRARGEGSRDREGRGPGRRMAIADDAVPTPDSEDQVKLAAFCQALMMSAEFRTIH